MQRLTHYDRIHPCSQEHAWSEPVGATVVSSALLHAPAWPVTSQINKDTRQRNLPGFFVYKWFTYKMFFFKGCFSL